MAKIETAEALKNFLATGETLQLTRNKQVYKAKVIGASKYARRFRNEKKLGIPIFFALTGGNQPPEVDILETDDIITSIRSLVDMRKKVRLQMIGVFAVVIYYARIPVIFIAQSLEQALAEALDS